MHHLLQRRSNQTTKSNHIHLLFQGTLNNRLGRYHHTKVYYLVPIASHYHRNNILTDIMYVTFHRGKQYFTGRGGTFLFFGLDYRLKNSHRFLHGTRCFHNLRQKHLSGTKQFSHIVHTSHQGTFNNINSFRIELQGFGKVFFQVIAKPFCQSKL